MSVNTRNMFNVCEKKVCCMMLMLANVQENPLKIMALTGYQNRNRNDILVSINFLQTNENNIVWENRWMKSWIV